MIVIDFIKRIMRNIRLLLNICLFVIVSRLYKLLYKVDDNSVFFVTDVRDELGGNLKDVYDYLNQEIYNSQIFCKNKRVNKLTSKDIKVIAKHLVTSKYIILEDMFVFIDFMHFRKEQEICQLWHGAGAYKKFGFSRLEKGQSQMNIHKGYRKYNKVIVSAESIRSCYAEAFDISIENVKATGIPGTDIFFDKEYMAKNRNELYKEFPQLETKKVILFAPTYRGTSMRDAAYNFDMLKLDEINEQLGNDYVFIFKWHPAAYNNILLENKDIYEYERYNGFYMDMSENRDINDLLLVTDILITDYSSVIFDYLLVDKPIIYYTYDLDDYSNNRGIYYDFEDYVYGEVATNQKELINAIKEENMMDEKREAFFHKFMSACDGHSTEKACKWIFDM